MLEKRNSKKSCLVTLILLTEKDATFSHYVMAHLIRKICTKLYQNLPRFVTDNYDNILVSFSFTVLTAVHLQNANAKFYNVG